MVTGSVSKLIMVGYKKYLEGNISCKPSHRTKILYLILVQKHYVFILVYRVRDLNPRVYK